MRRPLDFLSVLSLGLFLTMATGADSSAAKASQRYVVILTQAPVAQRLQKSASAREKSAYRSQLAASHQDVLASLGQGKAAPRPRHEYFYASNGFALDLTPEQLTILRGHPQVKAIMPRTESRLLTDAGPRWIGADKVWQGQVNSGAHRGEGVVIGVIDGGIKPDHPSFAETASDGYRHNNPFGGYKGLCASGQASCNNKLVGIMAPTWPPRLRATR